VAAAGPLPTRAQLAQRTRQVLKPARGLKAAVLVVASPDGDFVVKDFGARRTRLRAWMLRRELCIHRALEAVDCVPRVLGAIDPWAMALELRPGEALTRSIAARLPAAFLDELEAAVDAMHECGVVHLDLRHRDNVLLGESGHPVVLDFGSAMHFRRGSVLYRYYRPTLLRYDHAALRKWRERLRADAAPSPRTWRRRLRSGWRRLRGR